jgi:hypothetical protein
MSIKVDGKHNIIVNQLGYIDKMIAKFSPGSLTHSVEISSPTGSNFLQISTSEPTDKKKYLGLVMSLMYLGRFTRPDILMPVSYLATKSANPTRADYQKAIRILLYTHHTRSLSLTFRADADLRPIVYADASHMLHADGKGQGGIVITLGSAPIMMKSFKLKLITRSSTESELLTAEEATTYALWLSILLEEFNFTNVRPITIAQDNLSTIHIAEHGGNFSHSKHIINRQLFISQHIQSNDIKLNYCPTNFMPADMLTKPLPGPTLNKLTNIISLM